MVETEGAHTDALSLDANGAPADVKQSSWIFSPDLMLICCSKFLELVDTANVGGSCANSQDE